MRFGMGGYALEQVQTHGGAVVGRDLLADAMLAEELGFDSLWVAENHFSFLQLTYTQLGLIFSLSNLVWSPLQLGFGDLLGWRIIGRIADAPQHPIGNALISQGFRADRRGLALAINAAGSNLGTVAVPLLGGFLIATLGWRSTLMLFGLPGVLIGILLLSLLEENRGNQHQGQSAVQLGAEVWALLKHRDALLLLASHVIGAGGRGLGVATIYIPLYLSQKLQVNEVQLGILLTIMLAGSVIGPLIAGPLSDRIGRKPVLLGDYVLACLCFAAALCHVSSGIFRRLAHPNRVGRCGRQNFDGNAVRPLLYRGFSNQRPLGVADRRLGGWLRLCRGVRGHGRLTGAGSTGAHTRALAPDGSCRPQSPVTLQPRFRTEAHDPMDGLLAATTIHKISGKEICGVVVLEQHADGSWAGTCSRCAKPFHHGKDPTFEPQVWALRN